MTIDVLVEGWNNNGSTTREYFDAPESPFEAEYLKVFPKDDSGRPYQDVFESTYPSLNCNSGTLATFLSTIAPGKDPKNDEIAFEELTPVRIKLIRLINCDRTVSGLAIPQESEGMFVDFGVPASRVHRVATEFLGIVAFAMERRLSIYWG